VDAYKEEPGNPKYAFKVHFVFFFLLYVFGCIES